MIQDGGERKSLAELHDLVLPPEVSMWPSAPGWMLVGSVLFIALVLAAVRFAVRYRALRYRRVALAELARIRAARRYDALPALLKRVALAAHPRDEVAALSGPAWTRFLDQSGADGRFTSGAGSTLEALAYGRCTALDRELELLGAAAERWIRAQGPARSAR